MTSEDGRLASLRQSARLIGDLMRGRTHDRNTAAKLLKSPSPANAARHLNALESIIPGLEVSNDRPKKYWIATPPQDAAPVPLGVAVAACFGSSLATLFEGTTYLESMEILLKRVVNRAARAKEFIHLDRKFYFHARGGEIGLDDSGGNLDEVVEAVLASSYLRFTYTHFDGTGEKLRGRPLSIIVYEHQLYLILERDGARARPYRFSRMTDVSALRKRFEYPKKRRYSPRRLFRDSFGIFADPKRPLIQVRIKLEPRWSIHVESHAWHPTQEVEFDGEHPVVVLRVRHCPELERWILGFGEDAVVLEPPQLRAAIATKLAAAACRYEPPD